MTEIYIVHEVTGQYNLVHVPPGTVFADAIMKHAPGGYPGMTLHVSNANNKPATEYEIVTHRMQAGERWNVVLSPQSGLEVLLATTIVANITVGQIALTALVTLGSYLLAPKLPQISPEYQWDDDDPQFFSGQSNRMRPGSRVPDSFGLMRVWPDLIVEPDLVYNGSTQTLDEMYVVTNGTGNVLDVRLGAEDISELPNAGYQVYLPGDFWPLDYPIWNTSSYVGDIELPASNEAVEGATTFDLSSGGTITASVAGFFSDFTLDYFRLTGAPLSSDKLYRLVSIDGPGTVITVSPAPDNETTLSIGFQGASPVAVDVSDDPITYTFTWVQYYKFEYDVGYVPDGWYSSVSYTGADKPTFSSGQMFTAPDSGDVRFGVLNAYTAAGAFLSLTDVFVRAATSAAPAGGTFQQWSTDYDPTIPGDGFSTIALRIPGTTTAFSFDIDFQQGLYRQKAGQPPEPRSVEILVHVRAVGGSTWTLLNDIILPSGKSLIQPFTDKTRTSKRYTTYVSWQQVPALPDSGEYEVYFERDTLWQENTAAESFVDACALTALRGRQDISGSGLQVNALTTTLVRVTMSSGDARQVLQDRDLNCLVQRLLPDHANGAPGTLVPTSRIADAILYTIYSETTMVLEASQLARLIAIQADLDAIDKAAGEFNGIIDQSMSPEDQLTLIGGVGRIIIYRRGDAVGFNRLKAGAYPRSLINSRNKVEPESKVMNFSEANDPDAIIVRFMDASSNYDESSVEHSTDGGTHLQASEQSVIGITDPLAAQRMARYLWDKQTYERDVIEVSTTEDGVLLVPGDVFVMTDHLLDELPFDGEVWKVEGNTFHLDAIVPAGDYVARLRSRSGDVYGQTVGFTLTEPASEVDVPSWAGAQMPQMPNAQVGLLYSFTPVVTPDDPELWYVTGTSPDTSGTVVVSATAYRDSTYDCDSVTVITRAAPNS